MTTETSYSLAQLAQILSALESERRNPNSKTTAIKAIERNAAEIGLSAEDVLGAADGLLTANGRPRRDADLRTLRVVGRRAPWLCALHGGA